MKNQSENSLLLSTDAKQSGQGTSSFSPAIASAHHYMDWVLSCFSGRIHGRILEVGLGHGSYQPLLEKLGDYTGTDIDEELVMNARRRSPASNFQVADITDPMFPTLFKDKFDSIICFNVLEHLENDHEAIANLVSVLRENASLCILVPAFPFMYNDMDRLAGHHRRYTIKRVQRVAAQANASVEFVRYFNAIGGLGWLANGLKHYESLADQSINSQISIFDRYIVPVARVVDPFFRPVFGQSIVVSLKRSP